MQVRCRCRYLALVLLASAAGCGRDDGLTLAPVRGRVTVEGQPAGRGQIVFEPDLTKMKAGATAMGGIMEDGSYTLSTRDPGDGASVGINMVGIQVLSKEPAKEAPAPKQFKSEGAIAKAQAGAAVRVKGGGTLPYRDGKLYRMLTSEQSKDPNTSGITVDVKSGSNTVNFDVSKDGKVQIVP